MSFNDFSSSESSIESYRIKVELIVQGFIENVLEEELAHYEEQGISSHQTSLKRIINQSSLFWE